MNVLRVLAPAKINWTLEVLGKRSDGYHEVRSIMQTIDLADTITLRNANEITLSITGDGGALDPAAMAQDLAYRAAALLRGASNRGVHIGLEKRVPVAAGLGGGSSDAGAVLRGLRRLWALDMSDEDLGAMAAGLGSDVPFFLHGGTALASGHGERIDLLPDVGAQTLLVAWDRNAQKENKTGQMYAAIGPEHYSNGERTERLARKLRLQKCVVDRDVYNVFEQVADSTGALVEFLAGHAGASDALHLCGSGPAMYVLPASDEEAGLTVRGMIGLGLRGSVARTLGSADALAIEEMD